MSASSTLGDEAGSSSATQPPNTGRSTPADRVTEIALVGFAVAVVIAFWAPLLTLGFMTDELLSAWVSGDGFVDAVERAQTHQGNSPLYFALLWAWRVVVGSAEWLVRLPSVMCALAAAWQLARLGSEIDGGRRLTGLVAAFVLVVDVQVVLAATTARPYALLLLVIVVSARTLLRFLSDGSWTAGLAWVLTAVAALAMTPFAVLALVAHVVALVDRARGQTIPLARAPMPPSTPVAATELHRRLRLLCALGVLVSLPLVPQLVSISRRSGDIVIAGMPGPAELVDALVPLSLVAAVLIGALVGGWRSGGRVGSGDRVLRFVAAWAFGPTVLAWTISHATGTSVWVDRYRVGATPAMALLVGIGVSRIDRSHGRAIACAACVAVSLWSVSEFAGLQRQGWREAIEWAEAETEGEPITIAIDADLVEQENLALLDDPGWQAYLSAPIEHYGLTGRVVVLPKGSGPDVDTHERRIVDRLAGSGDTVVVITRVRFRGPPDHLATIRTTFGAAWTETAGPVVGPHQAVVFRR